MKSRQDYIDQYGSLSAAARALGLHPSTLSTRLRRANSRITLPVHPEPDLPIEDLITQMARRSEKRLANAASRNGQIIRIHTKDPVVIAFVGDPHLDDDGCDWARLKADIELLRGDNIFAINIGDTTNNWTGKLMRLYAEQDTGLKTARRLARWFMLEADITFLAWIMGNHDDWEHGAQILRLMNTTGIMMEDWQCHFHVEFDTGLKVPFFVAHDFPGSSQWNKMHSLMKKAMMGSGSGVYAAGHRHTAGLHWEPLGENEIGFWALRSAGYKALDKHAVRLGYPRLNDGQTTAVVINPREKDPREQIAGFKSLSAAVRYQRSLHGP